MSNSGFDTSQLDDFTRDLLSLAQKTLPKETKKFLKKSATKLSKAQKKEIKTLGIGQQGFVEKEILTKGKAGKVYKYNGGLNCRAFNSHPLAHLLDQGFIHKGGFKEKNGTETFVPGYKFIEKAEKEFQNGYNQDIENFIDNMLDNNGL